MSQWALGDGADVPADLLAFLRLKHLGGADTFLLEPVLIDSLWSEHLGLPVSPGNERAALSELAHRCVAGLDALGGSVQADLQALAAGWTPGRPEESSPGAVAARRGYCFAAVRYAERRALQYFARAAESRLGELDSLEYYQGRRLSALGLAPIESEEELDALKAAGRQISDRPDW